MRPFDRNPSPLRTAARRGAACLLLLAAAPAAAQDDPVHDFGVTLGCLAQGDRSRDCLMASAEDCTGSFSGGGTSMGTAHCYELGWRAWDERLNAVYGQAREELRGWDADFPNAPSTAEALLAMQRAWIGYRDRTCEFEASLFQGGTGTSAGHNACMIVETARQTLRIADAIGAEIR